MVLTPSFTSLLIQSTESTTGYKPSFNQLIEFLKYRTTSTGEELTISQQGYGLIDFMSYNPTPKEDSEFNRYEV